MSVLLLLGHGSSKHPNSSASVRMHAEILAEESLFDEVRCAFLKEDPLIDDCLDGLENESVVIVPDFLAEGYFTREVIPKKLGLDSQPDSVVYCPPVGTHPLMSELIVDTATDLLGAWKPEQTSLLLVGHGSLKNACSKQTLRTHLKTIHVCSDFAQVSDLWLEENPRVTSWREVATCKQVIVVPFLLNDGQHGDWDIPVDLGLIPETEVHGSTHKLGDYEVRVAKALGTSAKFAVVIRQFAEQWLEKE